MCEPLADESAITWFNRRARPAAKSLWRVGNDGDPFRLLAAILEPPSPPPGHP